MADLYQKIKDVAMAALGKKIVTGAVILAGGSGTRLGTERTKQMIELAGKPLIVHTLLAFERSECIQKIVVVAKKDEIDAYSAFCEEYKIKKVVAVVCGGATRQQSAKNGFDALGNDIDYVVIQDGARALTTQEQIREVVLAAYAHGAAIAACHATDTVKYADGVTVDETPERSKVWLAQTPQVFRDEIYRAAAYTAEQDGFIGTDDASLVENIGISVYLVDCGYENFKITRRNDLRAAEIILTEREENANASRTGI